MFCLDKIKYEHLIWPSFPIKKVANLHPGIAILNLFMCCQFEDSQIILPKLIPMSHHNMWTVTNEGSFIAENFSLSFGT